MERVPRGWTWAEIFNAAITLKVKIKVCTTFPTYGSKEPIFGWFRFALVIFGELALVRFDCPLMMAANSWQGRVFVRFAGIVERDFNKIIVSFIRKLP